MAFVSTILGYGFGGADYLWTEAAEAALDQGHEVMLALSSLTAAHPRIKNLTGRGALLHLRDRHTSHNGRRALWSDRARRHLRTKSSLPGALDAFRPACVVINQGASHDFLVESGLVEQINQTETPAVVICQSNREDPPLTPEAKEMAARLMPGFARLVFVSTHNLRLAERQIDHSLPNASVIHNPSLPSCPIPLPWPTGPIAAFATVARLENQDKGIDLLLAALREALGQTPGWTLNLYGKGPDESALRAQALELGLADRLTFHGHVDCISAIWRANHMLLLPSRREGCSLAMMEALRCGRPVLATPVGGVSDWIQTDVNGFVCSSCDVTSLAQVITHAWSRREAWPEMGRTAHLVSRSMDDTPGRTLLRLMLDAATPAPVCV